MNTLSVIYGGTIDVNVSVPIDDEMPESATIYVGKEGETYVMSATADFDETGLAAISFTSEDTRVPIDNYKYQINLEYTDGNVVKLPDKGYCQCELPDFYVTEALDETEVTS